MDTLKRKAFSRDNENKKNLGWPNRYNRPKQKHWLYPYSFCKIVDSHVQMVGSLQGVWIFLLHARFSWKRTGLWKHHYTPSRVPWCVQTTHSHSKLRAHYFQSTPGFRTLKNLNWGQTQFVKYRHSLLAVLSQQVQYTKEGAKTSQCIGCVTRNIICFITH